MESLYLLVPLSIALVFGALWVFFKASDDGQFEDLEGPALRILHDDDTAGDRHLIGGLPAANQVPVPDVQQR